MDKIEKLTDETGVNVELKFNHVPLSEMEILAKQENLKIRKSYSFKNNVMYFEKGKNCFIFHYKII